MRLEDLAGPTCAHCGADMPEGRRVDAAYCSRRCAVRSYHEAERVARLEAKAERPPCLRCGAPVPVTKDVRAAYCNIDCQSRAWQERTAAALPERACAVCGRTFRPKSISIAATVKTCSKRCAALMWRKRAAGT